MKKKKRPLIFTSHWRDFYILWIWKIAFIWITKADHTNPNKYFEIWNASFAKAIIFGSHGIGIGHSFGMED